MGWLCGSGDALSSQPLLNYCALDLLSLTSHFVSFFPTAATLNSSMVPHSFALKVCVCVCVCVKSARMTVEYWTP